jgi:ClpP class serine protease
MANKLYRLLDTIWNTPHLITEAAFHPIVDYLQNRNMGIIPQLVVEGDTSDSLPQPERLGNIGEIKIDGVMTYKPVIGACGEGPIGTSYQGILDQAEELIEAGVDTILLTHSSPGGEAAHCFTTALELRQMCDDAGIRLVSYIDTQSCSAALAIGVVADEIYIHPSAETGSIGCIVALMDKSKALASMGLKPIYIASSPGKTPFNTDGSFSEDFLAEIQSDVTRLANQFADHVSKFTGIPYEAITEMDAKSFHAYEAVEKGLANAVMDHKQFAAHMAASQGANNA